jgi:peptidoglycan glycosyltransferase
VNAPVRRVAIAVMVLFALLIGNANYVQVVRADKLRNDQSNLRTLLDEYQQQRGEIVVDGRAIATSKETNDRLRYQRSYPYGGLYGPLTGYYSQCCPRPDSDSRTVKTGLEKAENSVLSGSDFRLLTRRFVDLITGRDAKGGSVVLTINSKAQQAAYRAMKGHNGAVVALDPTTGAILAMVSAPSYDPNPLASHDVSKVIAADNRLRKDPNKPLTNRAISERYPPGSVFKVIVAAAALSNGYQPDTQIEAPDALPLPGSSASLHNFDGESCNGGGPDSLIHALTISCNTAFAKLALDLKQDAVRKQAEAFGITDQGFQMPLPVAPSTIGPIPDQASLALSAIGQKDVQITPLQGAMIAAAVANHGRLEQPFLVKEQRAPDLSSIERTVKGEESEVMPADVADKLGTMMVSVVQHGTGTLAQIPDFDVGGKTGTADHGAQNPDGSFKQPPHAWFIGYAGQNGTPRVAVAVLIENGGVSGNETTGGKAAAPIARDVMAAILGVQGGN